MEGQTVAERYKRYHLDVTRGLAAAAIGFGIYFPATQSSYLEIDDPLIPKNVTETVHDGR